MGDEQQAREKALQTVVIGQQAENLLNFDDPTADEQPSGIAATAALASTPAAASLISGTSSNPLDDLVSIFGNVGLSSTPAPAQHNAFGGLSFGVPAALSPAPPMTSSVFQAASPPPTQTQAQTQPQDDLLGLF